MEDTVEVLLDAVTLSTLGLLGQRFCVYGLQLPVGLKDSHTRVVNLLLGDNTHV